MKDAPNVYPVKKQEFLSKMAALGIIDSNSFLSAQQKIKQYLFNIGRLQGICDTIAALSFYDRFCLAAMLCLHSQLIAQNLLELPHLVASVLSATE